MEKESVRKPDYREELVQMLRGISPEAEKREALAKYHGRDIAGAMEMLDLENRRALYRLLEREETAEVFSYLGDSGKYLAELNPADAAGIVREMDADDAVETLASLTPELREAVLSRLDTETRNDILLIASYPGDEIGSMMTTNFIRINRSLTVKQAMRALVAQAEQNDNIYKLFVTDEAGVYCGAIDLGELIRARSTEELDSLIISSYPFVGAHEKTDACMDRIRDYAEYTIPVLSEKGHVIGAITAQSVLEATDEELTEDYARLAGLTAGEERNETLRHSMKKRLPWLVSLLFLGIIVSGVVGEFDAVVSGVAFIVCFQSLILDMSGNAGTQALAVTIRVLADGRPRGGQGIRLVLREARIALVNGVLLGVLSFFAVCLYLYVFKGEDVFHASAVAVAVCVSLALAMTVSGVVGTTVPLLLARAGVDPAVASGPLITTLNDLTAVVTYYGFAEMFLLGVFAV